ncbi:MAG: HlyD family efflux transporter periplasmic adaptor subunit [Clostridia bacterium]|jgi:HlyD family secretion protein|nr:HlyD family efflux transporter periplasmic adaptor subunit [Clostridia bacterium]
MTVKKKRKKGLLIGISIGVIVIFLLAFPRLLGGNRESGYTEETVKIGDIITNYSFSGVVESKNRESIISEKGVQIDEIELAEGDLVKKDDVLFKTTQGDKLKASIDGEISKIYVDENAQVMPGAALADIVDYENLQITVKVDEYDLSAIAVNKEVMVAIGAVNKEIKGKISSVSKEAVHVNGVSFFTAAIDLEKDEAIKVGMSAEIKIINQSVKGVTVVSMKALQFDENNQPYVFIKGEKSVPSAVYVQTGVNDGKTAEIKEGLKAGDIIMIPKTTKTNNRFRPGQGMAGRSAGGENE